MNKKIVEKRIKLFEKNVREYVTKFNCNNYEVVVMEQMKDTARASCYFDISGRIVTICYSLWWVNSEKLTNEEIKIVAKHEVLELVCAEITCALERFYSKEYVAQMVHNIIRIFEKR